MLLPVRETLEILIDINEEAVKWDDLAHGDSQVEEANECRRGERNHKQNCTKVPKLVVMMMQMLLINQIAPNHVASTFELSEKRDDPFIWAQSNHTSYIIDQDNINSTSIPSSPRDNPIANLINGQNEIAALDEADDDDEYDENDSTDGDNDNEEDEEDFFNINPADLMPKDKSFDDFDDFEALKLNDFYGDNRSAKHDKRPKSTKKPLPELVLLSQQVPARGNRTKQTAKERKPKRRRKRRRKARKRAKSRVSKERKQKTGHPTNQTQIHNVSDSQDKSRLTAASNEREHLVDPTLVNRCAMVSKTSGACIDYQSVEWAIGQARRLIAFQRPAGLNLLEPSESTLNAIGELGEWTTRLLAMRFGMSSEDVAESMDEIDVRQTSLWRLCPRLFRSPWARRCYSYGRANAQYQLDPNLAALNSGRYRSFTGQCNNPLVPNLGSSFMSFVRLNTPDYGDGIGSSRRPQSGLGELPPARLVSLMLHSAPLDVPSNDLSSMFASWGQLINHDLALASGARVATGHDGSCCQLNARTTRVSSRLGRVCMPIFVDQTDPVYGPFGVRCHDFKRSIAGLRPGCSLGPRTQLNLVSSFVDGSFVYGSTSTAGRTLRANSNGRGHLAVWNYFGRVRNRDGTVIQRKPLLPPQIDEPDDECLARPDDLYCFRSGDLRTNQQVPLVVLHTMHTRQHNRLAEALDQLNPHWSSERIFQEARHIHIAQIQHILMSEYLPLVLGTKTRLKFNLMEAPEGEHWDHYDASLNPGISQEFAAGAFRQGHSTVASEVYRIDVVSRVPRRVYRLRELFRQPWPLFEPGAVDEFLLGLTESPSRELDPFVSRELGDHLLQEPNEPVGLDLIAINIQRGRDQGVASYNAMREWCGLGRLETIDDLVLAVGNQSAHLMMQLYESIDDIDLYSGGLSEYPTESDGLLGPTFSCIVAQQFSLLRQGDRYWYESSGGPHAFTPEQLASIKTTTLSRIVCANSDQIWSIQPLAMRLPHPIYNPPVACQDLPDLDLSLWIDFTGRQAAQQQPATNVETGNDDGF